MSLVNMSGFSISTEAVVVPLKNGICFMIRVYKALIDADVDPITGQCSDYQRIREQIVQAEMNLQRSEQVACEGLKSLDNNIEILTRDMGKLEQELDERKQTLENLRMEQQMNEKLLREFEGALSQARSNLDSARDTLRGQEERKRNATIVTGVGAGLFAIPIIGWIAGSAMLIGGGVELDQASHQVGIAEEEVRKSESQVESYRGKVNEYEGKISQTTNDIRQKEEMVEENNNNIQKVKEQREAVGEFQMKVRKAVHILSVLSGRADVVESQTRTFILQEPVMRVMEEVMQAAGEITGNQLLYDEGIPQLIDAMRENKSKLAAICASNNAVDEGHY